MLRCASTPRINPYECALTKVTRIFLDSSMVEHSAVNRVVVGSSPTRGAKEQRSCSSIGIWKGKEAIRLRGQAVKTSPFHGGNTGSIPVGVSFWLGSIHDDWGVKRVKRRQSKLITNQLENDMPMWLNWQSSWFVISRLSVRVRSSA